MNTQCTAAQLQFHPFGRREVVARFDAGHLSSDGGALLLREADRRLDLTRRMAECFGDARQPGKVEHTVRELVAQRVHGLALGYEDLNDHDRLRCDPLLALAAGKADPTGMDRARERDRGHALAGSSTPNRLELGDPEADAKRLRYSKIVADGEALDRCERNGVDYVLGLARNDRLLRRIDKALRKSRARHAATGKASRRFREFRYRTRKSWSRARRVVAKAEWLAKGDNPRFVVTSLSRKAAGAQHLYEKL